MLAIVSTPITKIDEGQLIPAYKRYQKNPRAHTSHLSGLAKVRVIIISLRLYGLLVYYATPKTRTSKINQKACSALVMANAFPGP